MSAAALRELWEVRDSLYSHMRHEISEEAIEAVRSWRLSEASRLRSEVRADAMDEAAHWTPPPRIRVR